MNITDWGSEIREQAREIASTPGGGAIGELKDGTIFKISGDLAQLAVDLDNGVFRLDLRGRAFQSDGVVQFTGDEVRGQGLRFDEIRVFREV